MRNRGGMVRWLALAGAIVTEVAGTMSLRAAIDSLVWIVLVVAGYGTAFALLAVVLRRGMSIGVAYGLWASLGVALAAVSGALLFDDPFNWLMAAGIALIVTGVAIVQMGAQRAARVPELRDWDRP